MFKSATLFPSSNYDWFKKLPWVETILFSYSDLISIRCYSLYSDSSYNFFIFSWSAYLSAFYFSRDLINYGIFSTSEVNFKFSASLARNSSQTYSYACFNLVFSSSNNFIFLMSTFNYIEGFSYWDWSYFISSIFT